jgi:hypothetical protein
MSSETTLEQLALSRAVIQIVCRRCRHEAIKFPMELSPRVGWHCKLAQIAPKLRCSKCNSREVNVYEARR